MKKQYLHLQKALLVVVAVLPLSLFAQEKVKVLVKVVENGKTVTDTTYSYNSAEEAEKALKLMDMAGDESFDIKEIKGDKGHMVYVTKSGETKIIDGDDEMIWTTTETRENGDSLKTVIVKKMMSQEGSSKAKVIVIDGDENAATYDILLDDDNSGEKEKEIKVKVFTTKGGADEDVRVYVLDGDENLELDEDGAVKTIEKKVIIIKGDEESIKDAAACEEMKAKEMEMKAKQAEMDAKAIEMKAKEEQLKNEAAKSEEQAVKSSGKKDKKNK